MLDTASLSASLQSISIRQPPLEFLRSLHSHTPAEARILLTHIPLYRPPGTSCGPLRESNEPIKQEHGHQFQNLLTPEVSKTIIDIVRPLVVFSGDDHDYCYVQHNYGGMKFSEYTVKSFSWAMVSPFEI
jgi:ethanolamine phosphate phosphodiesterase